MPKVSSSAKSRRRAEVNQGPVRRSKRISERELNKNAKKVPEKIESEKSDEDKLFDELFEERVEIEKDYSELVADLPECRTDITEYDRKDEDLETKVWTPMSETDEGWLPYYIFFARGVLTLTQLQQRCISLLQAMKNSCIGYADLYVRDVLHESNYKPYEALIMLASRPIPLKIFENCR